jgi:HEPN domain-containing protein
MLAGKDLRAMAEARIKDAQVLVRFHRYDGAAYLISYAVELRLKARIAASFFGSRAFPETTKEFEDAKNLKIHDLAKLLKLSGREPRIQSKYQAEWDFVRNNWGPEARYRRVNTMSPSDVQQLISAVQKLMKAL